MIFSVYFTPMARKQLARLKSNPAYSKQYKAVQKTLGFMSTNLRHPSLNTNKFHTVQHFKVKQVFESYAENNTPVAFRVFWSYGPEKDEITVVSITSHP